MDERAYDTPLQIAFARLNRLVLDMDALRDMIDADMDLREKLGGPGTADYELRNSARHLEAAMAAWPAD